MKGVGVYHKTHKQPYLAPQVTKIPKTYNSKYIIVIYIFQIHIPIHIITITITLVIMILIALIPVTISLILSIAVLSIINIYNIYVIDILYIPFIITLTSNNSFIYRISIPCSADSNGENRDRGNDD